jgi:sugar transferase (PEP-CTERM/EpsH1 system associated)
MKILFVCHRLPFPPNRGGKIRPFNMIQHLSRKHEVIVASLAETEQELRDGAGLEKHCVEVIAELLPKPVRWRQACTALFTKEPSSVAYFRSSALHRRVQQKLREQKFDCVIVHCAFVAQYVLGWEGGLRWLDYGDLDSGKWAEYGEHRAFPLSLGYHLEAKKLRKYETKLAGLFHQCTVTTQGELDMYASLGASTPCRVIPNGVDASYFSRPVQEPVNSRIIAFLGRMDYYPNIDGILYFAQDILPIIKKAIPDVQLRVIGSNPSQRIRDLAHVGGVTVTGHVPDVRPYLADAAVAIAPLRLARGTQNKILESMAMGIPVVATPQAAKGIHAVPGKHLLVAGSPDDFAKRVIDALQGLELRKSLSEAAREQVERMHHWPSSMKILDEILEDVPSRSF